MMHPAISAAPTKGNPNRSGRNTSIFTNWRITKGGTHDLEWQAEHVQHIGQQAGVIVLLEGEIDPFGRLVLAADPAVGIAQVHPESLRLVQLGGGQQEQHLRIDVRFGTAASKVAQEHISVDRIARLDRVGLKRGEEFLAAAQAAVQQVGVSVTPYQEVAVALDT